MRWRVTLEAIDPSADGFRREFEFEKNLDGLADGEIGCSLEHGKHVMSEVQKIVVERECELWTEQSRVCRSCMGRLPIKDYRDRSFLTIYGPVKVRSARLKECQRCNPWAHFTHSPLAHLCRDRATPELMEISAKLGALLPYRQASDILETFLPAQKESGFTTLRNRTLKTGKRLHDAEQDRYWRAAAPNAGERQLELSMKGDPAREVVISLDTAHIPKQRRDGGRTFEAVVGHCGRGGTGDAPGPVFSFEGTNASELKAIATMALEDQKYDGHGEIIVLSDGEVSLKKLAAGLPKPATHILDWFHISMKIQPVTQLAETAPKEKGAFARAINRIKWRLWHGQTSRAISLILYLNTEVAALADQSLWAFRAMKLLRKLRSYIQKNKPSIINYSARYRSGKRIATSLAESSVNTLVAKRFVKKQQMRWSRPGAHYLLKVRTAVINGDLPKTRAKSGRNPNDTGEDLDRLTGQMQLKLAA